jgi:hypothetical protein
MVPALKHFSLVVLVACFGSDFCSIFILAQSSARVLRAAGTIDADPVGEELKSLGERGQLIQQTRAGVFSILATDNACSAWFRSVEPEAAEKFLSLEYAVDFGGPSEIRRLESASGDSKYHPPYVARTRQGVGWGSTITLNLNGAFFKNTAIVRLMSGTEGIGPVQTFRQLVIGPYSGASPQARMLTLLHEYGHVQDMLPVDAGLPLLSMQNSETVMMHCMRQIQAEVKRSHKPNSASFPVRASLTVQPAPNRRQGLRPPRNQLYVNRGEPLLPPRFD